eukprot:1893073-Pyramimonas_sp.AAC.2
MSILSKAAGFSIGYLTKSSTGGAISQRAAFGEGGSAIMVIRRRCCSRLQTLKPRICQCGVTLRQDLRWVSARLSWTRMLRSSSLASSNENRTAAAYRLDTFRLQESVLPKV